MANKKITELTEETSPQGADLLALVDDVSGTPTTKKVTVTNLMTQAPVQTADISGLATQVSLGNHEALTSAVHGISAFGATLVDDADASAARTTLGLGTAATTASSDYATAYDNIVNKTASFTLSASENGKVINCDLGSRIDITIPAGLTAGFNCRVVQKGVGRVRFLTDGTTTLNSYQTTGNEPNAVIGRYGVVDLVNTSTNAYHLTGDYEYLFVYSNSWSNAFDGGTSQEFRTAALSRPTGSWSDTTQYTLSAWIKPNATGGDGGVIGLLPTIASSTGTNASYVGSYYHTSGTKYAWYQGAEHQGGSAFTVGSWDHLVQIWDGSNLKGYINGVLVVSATKTNNGLGTSGIVAIHGSSRGRWNDRAPINIDEISIWDSALSDGGVSVGSTATGDIATLYNSGSPSDLTSLSPIGWWLMGDSQTGQTNGGTTPTTITDVGIGSHTKADGTLFGSATYSNQTP